MTCPCEKRKCAGDNPENALTIINEAQPVLFHTVRRPASLGDETDAAPETLQYKNVLLVYEANGHAYLYSSDGTPTFISYTKSDADIERLEQAIAELQGDLGQEALERHEGDENLQALIDATAAQLTGKIKANAISIEQNAAAIQTNTSTIAEVKTELEGVEADQANLAQSVSTLESTSVQKDTAVSADASTVTLTKSVGPLDGEATETAIPLPVASSTEAGVMNTATFNAVQENSENVDSILGGAVVVSDLPAEPTQAELTAQWKAETGKTTLINRASIYDEANKLVWYYYENVNEWKSMPAGDAAVSVSIATNDTPGIVKGSTENGQVAVEADGTMSLNGYDGMQHDLENLTQLVEGIEVPKVGTYVMGNSTNELQSRYMGHGPNGVSIGWNMLNASTGERDQTKGLLVANLPYPTSTHGGVMSVADKSKLDSLATITAIGENLELTDEGVLNATGGGEVEVPKVPTKIPTFTNGIVSGYRDFNTGGKDGSWRGWNMADYNTETGQETNFVLKATAATVSQAGLMSSTDKNKLNSLLEIKSLNDSLELDENGQLSVVGGGGSDVNLLSEYTATVGDNDVYNAAYVNARLDGESVVIGVGAAHTNQSKGSGVAVGNQAKASAAGIAIGLKSDTGENGVAVGVNSHAYQNAVAIGYSATNNYHTGAIAVGDSAKNTRDYEVSFCNAASFYHPTRYLANVRAGELPTDAVNLQQMQDYVAENAGNPFTEMETTRVQNLPPAVVTGFEDTTYGTDTITMHLDTKDLATGGVSVQELMIEGATANTADEGGHAGLMTAFQATQLATLAAGGAGGLTADEVTKVQNLGTGSLTNMDGVLQTEEAVEIEFSRQNLVAGGSTTQTATISAATTEEAGVMTPAMVVQLNSLTPVVAATADEITAAWEAA